MITEELRVQLAKILKDYRDVPVTYMDAIGTPKVSDDYTTVELKCQGTTIRIVVMTTQNFYEALTAAMHEAMPGTAGRSLS